MATISLPANGQTLTDIPDYIAEDDKLLRDLLSPTMPDLANATFDRKTEGGLLTVTVNKKAGTKGGEPASEIQYPQGKTREEFLVEFPMQIGWVVEMEKMFGAFQRCGALPLSDGRAVLVARFEQGYNVVFINTANEKDKQEYFLNLSTEALLGMIGLAHSLNDAASWSAQWNAMCDILVAGGITKVIENPL